MLPFLLVFAVAIVFVTEIGVARLVLERAAGEGARIGSLTNDDDQIRVAVDAAVAPLAMRQVALRIEPGQYDVPRSNDPRGSLLRVELRYALPVPLAFAGLPGVTVSAVAARVVEWTP